MIQQAASGGQGTAFYLSHVQKFADFATYLQKAGASAYTYGDGPQGSQQATATDGQTTMTVNVQLAGQSDDALYALPADQPQPPVHGIATVNLQLPAPESIDKIINLAVALAEVPAGIPVGSALTQALFKPILQ